MTDEKFPTPDSADAEIAVDTQIDFTVREIPVSILTAPSLLSGLR
jgi:hypothetical protein